MTPPGPSGRRHRIFWHRFALRHGCRIADPTRSGPLHALQIPPPRRYWISQYSWPRSRRGRAVRRHRGMSTREPATAFCRGGSRTPSRSCGSAPSSRRSAIPARTPRPRPRLGGEMCPCPRRRFGREFAPPRAAAAPPASLLLARKRSLLALEVARVAGLPFAADRHVANSPIDADGFPGGGQRFDGFLARERHEVAPASVLANRL